MKKCLVVAQLLFFGVSHEVLLVSLCAAVGRDISAPMKALKISSLHA